MSSNSALRAEIEPALHEIDKLLAKGGYALSDRPLKAAIKYAEIFVEEVANGDRVGPPGDAKDFVSEKWFAVLFKEVHGWYEDRFGELPKSRERSVLTGAVLIYETPFEIRIPTTTRKAGTPGKTFWICFHDAVQRGEKPLDWIKSGPPLDKMPAGEKRKATRLAREVANRIRYINIRLTGLSPERDERSLHNAIFPHLERAAKSIVVAKEDELKRAHWDMHMACETAIKFLSKRKGIDFKREHNLLKLSAALPAGIPLDRVLLEKMPDAKVMISYRYGEGPHVTTAQTYKLYRLVLQILENIASCLDPKYQLNNARIELKRPPWMEFL